MYQIPYVNPPRYPYFLVPPYTYQRPYVSCASNNNHMRNGISSDFGPKPFVININEASKKNNTYRTALWTGPFLQVTLMSLNVGETIGLEMHPNLDQFLRIEQGQGFVQMGSNKNHLSYQRSVYDDTAIFIPAGTWHNLINTGNYPLKLYYIYAPPNHQAGTIHAIKEDAVAAEDRPRKKAFDKK